VGSGVGSREEADRGSSEVAGAEAGVGSSVGAGAEAGRRTNNISNRKMNM